MKKKYDETRIAELIVSVLPAGVARALSWDRETVRYSVRAADLKLRSIVLASESLRRLVDDPVREIKIEYLQRDLIRNAATRTEFRYPRPHVALSGAARHRIRFSLPLASMA